MPGLNGSLIWYELMSNQPDRAQAFYEKVLGWTFEGTGEGRGGYRLIKADGEAVAGMLPLTQEMCDHGAKPIWLIYVGCDDVDGKVAEIEAAGGRTWMPPFDVPGIGRLAMVADPQGAPFYLMNPIPPEGGGESRAFSPDLIGHCTWNELQTSDLDAALAFYRDRFGWEETGRMPMGPAGDYVFLSRDGVPIGAAMQGSGMAWRPNFRVADIDATLAAARAEGEVVSEPHEVPGGQKVMMARDPDGITIGLVAK